MKHAFLIIAYKHALLLAQLVKHLDHPDSFFFIHIDKKSSLLKEPSVNALRSLPNVYVSEKPLHVPWAGFSHVKATVQLLETALQNTDITYFHLLSGQCFPLRSTEKVFGFFETNSPTNFIECFPVPNKRWSQDGGMDRLNYYYLHDVFDPKDKMVKLLNSYFVGFQKKLNIKRQYPNNFPSLYGGSAWWSLHRDFIEYSMGYIKRYPSIFKRFEHTHCPDEMFFQTVLMNSPFKDTLVNNNLRFIDWHEVKSSPANLNETYFHELKASDCLIARKFEPVISDKLIKKIKSEMLEYQDQDVRL